MKKLANFLMLVAVVLFAASCSDSTGTDASVVDETALETHRGSAGDAVAIERFSLADIDVNLEAMEMLQMEAMDAESADAAAVMNIHQSLLGAEKEAQLLDVKFSMSDEPVANGVFVFGVEAQEDKNLTLQMFDEEGFQTAAHNQFDVNTGNNYKALNVNSLDNGDYVFRLKDAEGKELTRTVSISHE